MAKTKRASSLGRARSSRSANRTKKAPPALASPVELSALDKKARRAAQLAMKSPPGSRTMDSAIGGLRTLDLQYARSIFDIHRDVRISWPPSLYIPSGANYQEYWPLPPPAENRYDRDWTHQPIGGATASRVDGSLFAWAGSPTVRGAIDNKVEAGLGVVYQPQYTLGRLRIEPELIFTARYEWNVNPPPVVRVTTLVIASLLVGGYRQNPATGGFESLATIPTAASPWRRHEVFNHYTIGHGAAMMTATPFTRSGKQAAADVLVERGRTYLLSVVAQLVLRIETTRSDGKPMTVTQGTFNTWGSLAGIVRQIRLRETKLIA